MKTKYMLLVSLLIILSASIVSAETKHLFVVGDDSSTSDVISVTDVSLYVQGMIGTNYETKLSSQVTRDMLEDKVTTFVYKGQGLIIVGENSPSDHVILATEIEAFLENNRGVNARIMINTEVTSDDLIEAIGWTEKELSVIMVSSPESKGGEAKIKKGDSIVFTAKPSDLEGDYTRAFFFDMSMFTCSNTEWEMTCTSKKDGVGNVYVEIYKNNKKYKSNVIRVVVGDSNSVEPIEHEFKDILSEKASKTYTVDGVDYDITVTSISDNSRVQFKVNGEFTRVMFVGDVYALSDTSQIQVLSIDEDDAGRDIVEFAFKGKSTEFTLIKKGFTGGSFEDIITEGETRTYTVNGVDYEISSLDADFSKAMFKVNGETTPYINREGAYTLANGAKIIFSDLEIDDAGRDVVEFEFIKEKLVEEEKDLISGGFKDILQEKATRTYNVDDINYEISALSISDNSRVQFKVNGEFTRVMFVGDVYTLSDTSQIQVLSIGNDDAGKDIVEFAFKAKTGEIVEVKKIVVGGSFEDIITEGETRTYTVNGVDYEISSLDADFSKAMFKVNGETTPYINREGAYTLANGAKIIFSDLEIDDAGRDVVEFAFKAAEVIKEIPVPVTGECNGCSVSSTCLPFGTRLIDENLTKFCGLNKVLANQKEKEEACQNSYECKTNQCADGVCGSLSEELEQTRGMLQKILDWLGSIFKKG